jgi:zinc transport system permease protein
MNIDILLNISFFYALLIGATIGGVAAYIGTLMVTKRMTLMAGALGHLTLPGVALALNYGFDVSLGALIFLIIGIFLIWLLEKRTKLPVEALTAIVFTSSVAIAFLFLPEGKTVPALLGDISHLTFTICMFSLVISGIIFFIVHFIFKRMILISISRDIAQTRGINVSRYNFIYLTSIALIVALGVRIIGGLMTAAIIAIPASTSRNFSRNLTQNTFFSLLLGTISTMIGIFISTVSYIPVGSAIILSSTTFFILSLFLIKHH